MWPWHRVQRAVPAGRAVPAVPGRPVPAVPPPARQPEWATLPPIQRSVEPMRPVSPQADLGDSLVSWRNPSFLAPLGHLVSADAPSGVIHRLIEPAAPPATGPAGPSLEFATAPARRPQGRVVQRMLAPIASWVNRESRPADPEPDRGHDTRTSPDPALPPAEPPLPVPAPISMPAPPPSGSPPSGSLPSGSPLSGERPALVQRSAPAPASGPVALLTRAPAPQLPIRELPVLHAGAQEVAAAEPGSAPAPSVTEPGRAADGAAEDHGGDAPTLGTALSSPAHQPAAGGSGGTADVTGQEHRAPDPAAATGLPAFVTPAVQRAATAESPAAPAPEHGTPRPQGGSSGAGGVPDTGRIPTPGAGHRVTGDLGGAADSAGPGPGGVPVTGTSERLMPVIPAVQRIEPGAPEPGSPEPGTPEPGTAEPGTPESGTPAAGVPAADRHEPVPAEDGVRDEVPTLGAGSPLPATPPAHGDPPAEPPARAATDPLAQRVTGPVVRVTDPVVQRVTAPAGQGLHGPVVQAPVVQGATEAGTAVPPPSRPGAPRRLGLGPPLAPGAVTVQLSQAAPTTTPTTTPTTLPPAVPASLPPGPVGSRTGESTEPPAGTADEVIAPLLGDSASPVHDAATTTDPPAQPPAAVGTAAAVGPTASASTAAPVVQTARDPGPPPVPSAAEVLPVGTEVLPEHAGRSAPAGSVPPPASLPVLRAHESAPQHSEEPAPVPSPPPVVARLIGDRSPPLLAVTMPGSARTEPSTRAQHHDAPVQRTASASAAQVAGPGAPQPPAQPLGAVPPGPIPPGPVPLGPSSLGPVPPGQAGYPAPVPAPLQLSLAPAQPASVPAQHPPVPPVPGPARHASAPVVQAALVPAPEQVPAAPVALQAQEIVPGPEAGLPGEPDPGPAPAAGPPGQAPAGAQAAGAAGSPDELVKKLFDPLLRRLKTELRLDRERRGMLTDLRH